STITSTLALEQLESKRGNVMLAFQNKLLTVLYDTFIVKQKVNFMDPFFVWAV
ncbi:Nucleosome Assembly Protein 1-Like 3, partial [Manis pentadactyla]